ncbi:lymphocyte antigen 6H-like [Suricata suricatta]|uniref:lymphocyte antigen 6H-like n=1 Tax=Suricata suricatta TaxID=37032 RepID=UPI00115556C9|nr:lymphocyte antigen 6H-like [Suricata suricatta]
MGGIQLALLLFLLGWERGLSLQCYSCTEDMERAYGCQQEQCPLTAQVCYNSKMRVTFSGGMKRNQQFKGCAPSCKEAQDAMNQLSQMSKPESPKPKPGEAIKYEVQGVSCCDRDLCNGGALPGRSPWALAGGLLLSLGAACLWTLL